MERETKTITTKNGHVVVIKKDLTGREVNKIKEIVYSAISFDGDGESSVNISGSYLLKQELASLEVCLVSIDGKTADLVNAAQDLPNLDYQEVVMAINAETQNLFPTVKTELTGSGTSPSTDK